ncbi:MAG: helix-turn-helix domain-containing protein [Bdellovibrionota bacterium]
MRHSHDDSLRKLHPIGALGNAPAAEGEIRIERLEKRLKPRVPFPHKHDFYHFLYVERGSGWHEIDFARFEVRKSRLFFVRPGQVHAWWLAPATRGFVLEFTRSSLEKSAATDRLLAGLGGLPSMMESEHGVLGLFQMMLEEYLAEEAGYRALLEHLLQALLIRLERTAPPAGPAGAKDVPALTRFRELVERHFQTQHSVEFYARQLGTSTKTLTTQISRVLGKSAGSVIQERCLVEAKRLLVYSDLPIAEIGYRIGYEDPNYFARLFRQKSGMSPGRYRKLAGHTVPHS